MVLVDVSAAVPSGKQDQIDKVKVHAEGKDVIKGTNEKIKSIPMNVGVAAGVNIVINGLLYLLTAKISKRVTCLPSSESQTTSNKIKYSVLGGTLSFFSGFGAWKTTQPEVRDGILTAIEKMARNDNSNDLNLEPNNNQMAFALLGIFGPIILATCLYVSNKSENHDAGTPQSSKDKSTCADLVLKGTQSPEAKRWGPLLGFGSPTKNTVEPNPYSVKPPKLNSIERSDARQGRDKYNSDCDGSQRGPDGSTNPLGRFPTNNDKNDNGGIEISISTTPPRSRHSASPFEEDYAAAVELETRLFGVWTDPDKKEPSGKPPLHP